MLYVGTTNIILMYNPIFLLSTITSYHSDFLYIMILSNFIMVIAILYIWVYNGYIFVNNWLYCISFSTIILSNIYFLFIYVDFIYYNLYYYIYYFTITSIIIWYIMILTLYFIKQ